MHDPRPTRSSLIRRLKDACDDDAWREFYGTYGGLIRRLALKAGLRDAEADEVVQEVCVNVSRNIGGFTYDRERCSFKHWLSQAVRWRIRDQLDRRRTANVPTGRDLDDPPPPEGDPLAALASFPFELEWEAEWQRHLIRTTAARVKSQVHARQFQIFHLHVLRDRPAGEVAQRLGVTRSQVYLAKLRVGRLFRREIRRVRESSLPPSIPPASTEPPGGHER